MGSGLTLPTGSWVMIHRVDPKEGLQLATTRTGYQVRTDQSNHFLAPLKTTPCGQIPFVRQQFWHARSFEDNGGFDIPRSQEDVYILTADQKRPIEDAERRACIVISTYSMLGFTGRRGGDTASHGEVKEVTGVVVIHGIRPVQDLCQNDGTRSGNMPEPLLRTITFCLRVCYLNTQHVLYSRYDPTWRFSGTSNKKE